MLYDAKEEVWLERDNIIEWVVMNDDTPVSDLSSVTQIVVCIGGIEIDSDQWGSGVLWATDSVTGKELSDGTSYTGNVIRARLGRVSGVSAGEYDACRVVTYDPTYVSGLVVSDNVLITVYDPCV